MSDPIANLNALLGAPAHLVGPFGPAAGIDVFRWRCPLRTCNWQYWSIDEADAKAAFLGNREVALATFGRPGGEIHEHIHAAHRVEEYVQEVIDLRREPEGTAK